jgi:hypothetical protein
MPPRRRHDPLGSFLDNLSSSLEGVLTDAAETALDNLLQSTGSHPYQGSDARYHHSARPLKPLKLIRSKPMKLRAPRTWTQICNWLAAQGFGNHYVQSDGPVILAAIQSITVHALVDGQPRNLFLQLDDAWTNPHVISENKKRQGD